VSWTKPLSIAAGFGARNAGQHGFGIPALHFTALGAPALQAAVGDIDPVQRVFLRHPYRAFAHGIAGVDD
jgi:hypothetical protein